MRRERFDEHVSLIYEAVGSEQGWQELLSQLVTDLDARSAFVTIDNVKTKEMVVATGAGISEQDWSLMTGEFLGKDIWTDKIYTVPEDYFYESESLVSKAELFRSEFYNELCTLVDLRYAVAAILNTHDDQAMRIAIQGAHDHDDFSDAVDYLNRLTPHLRQAGDLHHKIGIRTLSNRGLNTVIESVPEPVAIIDRYANLLCHNSLFDELLVDGSLLKSHGNCVQIAGQPELLNSSLNTLLALQPAVRSPKPVELSLGTAMVKLEPLESAPSFDNFGVLAPITMLTISDVEPKPSVNVELCQQRFGLTPKETRIIEGLLAGKSLDQIASHYSRSIYTIRAQIASIFRKTDTNSQARLLAKLSSL